MKIKGFLLAFRTYYYRKVKDGLFSMELLLQTASFSHMAHQRAYRLQAGGKGIVGWRTSFRTTLSLNLGA